MSEDMIERVARAITVQDGEDPDGTTIIADRPARWMLNAEVAVAAIAAMREPTAAMLVAAIGPDAHFERPADLLPAWQRAIDMALKSHAKPA